MIVVDTSALIAILLGEAEAETCALTLARADKRLISAGTLAETMIVAARHGVRQEMARLIESLRAEVVTVTAMSAHRSADAYQRWGKGFHPAALNYGDCFAYALAKERGCPLLYVGKDFARTDIGSALA